MKRITIALGVLVCIGGWSGGCGKPTDAPVAGGMVTQGGAPPPQVESGVDLASLTRDLKRWIVSTKERPGTFEEYVAKAKVTVPPAPPGKKFAISKEMRIVLVDR